MTRREDCQSQNIWVQTHSVKEKERELENKSRSLRNTTAGARPPESYHHRSELKMSEATGNPSASASARKVQSLLEINKTLAKENTFLSQQFDVLSKECVSLVRRLVFGSSSL